MASLIDRLKFLVSKNAQQTSEQYNRAIIIGLANRSYGIRRMMIHISQRDIARTPRFIHWLIS